MGLGIIVEPKIDKASIISMLIIFSLISATGIYAFYFTDWRNDTISKEMAQRPLIPEFQEDSRILDQRIVLRKNKSITVNKNKLVFKGFKDERIHLDVYLLELDPEYAYSHYISTADTHKTIRLGDSIFQFLAVDKGVLQLKIVDLYRS
jgi:hypothetical protein